MKEKGKKTRARKQWTILLALYGVVSLLILMNFFVSFPVTFGVSMEPTLKEGDMMVAHKVVTPTTVERGDIIIFKYSKYITAVKRVIGKPGEEIEIKDSVVYINGQPLQEDYLNKDRVYFGHNVKKQIVPEGKYYVVGDNRLNSKDSRNGLGFADIDDIKGIYVTTLASEVVSFDKLREAFKNLTKD